MKDATTYLLTSPIVGEQTILPIKTCLSVGSDGNNNNVKPSSWWVKDVSFLRLKQVNISYTLPKKWTDPLLIKNAQIYLMGTNLLTFSKFKLWDPELNTSNGTAYPNVSSYSIGLKFNF